MNCFDCTARGVTAAAVAVCASCGAGVCADCVRRESVSTGSPATPGNPVRHATRRLVCVGCDSVLRLAA